MELLASLLISILSYYTKRTQTALFLRHFSLFFNANGPGVNICNDTSPLCYPVRVHKKSNVFFVSVPVMYVRLTGNPKDSLLQCDVTEYIVVSKEHNNRYFVLQHRENVLKSSCFRT